MPILKDDIRLMASERLTDNDDGGGRITGVQVQDAQSNNLFPDVSDLDRVYGRVNLRKAHLSVETDDTDVYYGSHIILTERPTDPKIGITLFSTDSATDERDNAQTRLESYVVRGPESYYVPLGSQLTGQRMILCYATTSTPLPEVGDSYVLSTETDGNVTQEQYVRVTAVEHEERTFIDGMGEFTRRVITIEISDALRATFQGVESAVRVSNHQSPTLLRSTQVADASRYYGAAALADPVSVGDLNFKTDTIYSQLVPSATTETSVVDVQAGELKKQTTAGVEVETTAHTIAEVITLSNRGYNYVNNLQPLPSPGSLTIDYMAQGRWYRLIDNGSGELSDGAGGSGTVDYATGSTVVTLGALPDSDTSLIYSWGSPVHYQSHAGAIDIDPPEFSYTVTDDELQPGTVVISWPSGGSTVSVTDNGDSTFSGNAIGGVDYMTGEIIFRPVLLPDSGAVIQLDYDYAEVGDQSHTQSAIGSGTVVNLTLTTVPVKAGSISISCTLIIDGYIKAYRVNDNGAGALTMNYSVNRGFGAGVKLNGTVDYTTGAVQINISEGGWHSDWTGGSWNAEPNNTAFNGGVDISYVDATTAFTPLPGSASFAAGDIELNLTPYTTNDVIPGSVDFIWGSDQFTDNNGSIYRASDSLNVGSISYDTGIVTLQTYSEGANSLTISGLLTTYGDWHTDRIFFRTPGAPLRPASLYIRATDINGTLITVTSDASGNITGDGITGTVIYETGIVDVSFTTPVFPNTAYFNCVLYSTLPLDADILGLDPVRLPVDGRVPIFRDGNVVVIHNTDTTVMPDPVSAGQTVGLGAIRITEATVADAAGTAVPLSAYTLDLTAGTITFADPLNLSAYTQPLTVTHRIEDMVLITDVQITGQMQAVNQISHDYPVGSLVSSALIVGDVQARVANVYDQQTWTGEWSDDLIGSATTAEFNDTTYPLDVTNRGAITERWALIFTGTTSFKVVGESIGEIAIGDTSSSLAPINPNTGAPYFTLNPLGWGSGWSTNNVLRFNTVGANFPMWLARTTLQGAAEGDSDSFRIQIRGNANA